MKKTIIVLLGAIVLVGVGWWWFQSQPPEPSEDVAGEIKQLFIEKYNKPQDEVRVTIAQQENDYVRGGVKFGKDGIGEGGIFLATKVDGKWQLVFDGNGMIKCSILAAYTFPVGMAPDCID